MTGRCGLLIRQTFFVKVSPACFEVPSLELLPSVGRETSDVIVCSFVVCLLYLLFKERL